MAMQSGDGIQVPRTGGASSHASGRSELAPRDVTVPRARPVPKLRDVVELYIKNRLPGDIHPSFQRINGLSPESSRPSLPASSQTEPTLITKSVLASDGDNFTIEENGSFDAEAIYAEAESEKARFCDSLETYEQVADPKYRTNITLKGKNHTWDEVLEEVRKVVDKKSDGFWSKVRQGLENFGESNDAFDAWMGLLPTQSQYCSLLCGGLKLVVRAAARLNELNQYISDALAEIPLLLNSTKLVEKVFQKSKELHRCSSTLYVSTLAALEHIVAWLQQKAIKKGFKAFFKQEGYEREMTRKITSIKIASDHFAEAAKVCSYQKQDAVHRDVRQNSKELRTNRLMIERSMSESAQQHTSLGQMVKAEAGETRQELETKILGLEGLLKDFLSANERINPKTHGLRQPMLPTNGVTARVARLKIQKQKRNRLQGEALANLDYEESIPSSDVKDILKLAWVQPKAAQDRAVSLMQSRKLHSWIKNHHSSILFVNGNYNASARQSPLSFVSAKFMDSMQSASNAFSEETSGITAHAFFCGQHLNSGDPDWGIAGTMRSLIAQLLVIHDKFDIALVEKLRNIDPLNVDGLCRAYFRLIMQIPAQTMVFCIIDGLTLHEVSRARCREAFSVVQTLVHLVEACSGPHRCVFKVLLTCPGTSRELYKEMPKDDVVWMPKKVSSQGGFTAMKWTTSAGKDLDHLAAD